MCNADQGLFPVEVNPYERLRYSRPEENLDALVDGWNAFRGRLIVFLGAGASIGARTKGGPFLDAYRLRNRIYLEYIAKDRQGFDPKSLGLMSLEQAATLACTLVGGDIVKSFVAKQFLVDTPLWQHSVIGFLEPKAVFTTNYDNLIEIGWTKAQAERPIGSLQQVFQSGMPLQRDFIPLYKPHGTVAYATAPIGQGGIVLEQSDYFKMMTKQQLMLREFMGNFGQSCVIFIGYSFNDLDIAANLYDLRQNDPGGPPWFAVFPRYELTVRRRLYKEFGILQIARTFLDFMINLDERVDFIPPAWKFSKLPDLIRNCGLTPPPITGTAGSSQ
jgi:hypothetical protein